jgi:hypothetical protein
MTPSPSPDLVGLLERVEAATGPDGRLERDVLDAIWPNRRDGYFVHLQITASLDAALAICERAGSEMCSHPLDLLNDATEYLLVEHGWKPNQPVAAQLARAVVVTLLRALLERKK